MSHGSWSQVLTVRALGLGLLAAVLMAAMLVLGLWQLGVYDVRQHDSAASQLDRAAKPLDDVIGPDDPFPAGGVAQPVRVTGRYLADEQFEVRHGQTLGIDRAVVTPLAVAGGSALLVVRGQGDADVQPPSGEVTLTGFLEPSDPAGSSLSADRVTDGLRTAALVQDFDQDLYSGYVVLRSSDPADSLKPVTAPLPDASRWAGIRNLLYAIQWWVFAGFVGFMWWRIVTEPAEPQPSEGPGGSLVDADTGADDTAGSAPRSVV